MAQIWPKFVTITADSPWNVWADANIADLEPAVTIVNLGPSSIHVGIFDHGTTPATTDRGIPVPDIGEAPTAGRIQLLNQVIKPNADAMITGQNVWCWVLSGRAKIAFLSGPLIRTDKLDSLPW